MGSNADRHELQSLRRRVSELERSLHTEAWTGCRTRAYLTHHFSTRGKAGAHLLMVDIDDFKSVNDNYGHHVGDALILEVARYLIASVDDRGFVVRLGGDEFCLWLTDTDRDAADRLGRDLVAGIARARVHVGELTISRKVSIGTAEVLPGMELSEALIAADDALRRAKRAGKNRAVRVRDRGAAFGPALPTLEEVRLGLQRGEIGYDVQPIVTAASGEVVGFEALLRWTRRTGERLGPAMFLDTMTSAYDAETLPPLEAARAVADWAARACGKFISFNISSAFLERAASRGFDWIREIVGDTPHEFIVFELIETAVHRRPDAIADVVGQLRDSGIRVALDDFGVGYSSLARLSDIQVDFVKIDRRFVQAGVAGGRDRGLLEGMVQITRSMGALSIAEGVETAEELAMIQSLGVDLAQGFHLGRPQPHEAYRHHERGS